MSDYDWFIELSLQQCKSDDYKNDLKVKLHNRATRLLQSKMKEINDQCTLLELLSHNDDRVKLNASLRCIQLNILVEKNIDVLNRIINTSEDSSIRFSAKMLLKQISIE